LFLFLQVNDERSVYYWCWKNDIPVYCPAITDGSVGDMMFFHQFNKPGLIVDLIQDIRALNCSAMQARKTGMVILGGGVVKHHICNANLMRNGADFAVRIHFWFSIKKLKNNA
jgi:deoxyhypusine synthase